MFDTNCYKLAELFLSDETPAVNSMPNRRRLAQAIQDTIESEIQTLQVEAVSTAHPQNATDSQR